MGARGQLAKYAECGWFLYVGVHAAQVTRMEARRIGAIPAGSWVGIEPNCLGYEKSFYLPIGVRF